MKLRLPRNKKNEVLMWLHDNVAPCFTADRNFDHYRFSGTAMIAEWKSVGDEWLISVRGPFDYMTVDIKDEKWASIVALKWGIK